MEKEPSPQEYTNRHHKKIHLDTYMGMARDIMDVNRPVADGFMRVSDIRKDIAIVQKPKDRVTNYDQLGATRVAKLLQLPQLNNQNPILQTTKDADSWYVSVNDQELAQRVARSGTGKKDFDERYVTAFGEEVNKGVAQVLRKEKLLNAEEYNLAFLVSYWTLVSKDLLILLPIEMRVLNTSASLDEAARGSLVVLAVYIALNTMFNSFNLLASGFGKIQDTLFSGNRGVFKYPSYNDPFIRHSFLEYFMPVVPFDRLVRGLKYLDDHGSKLIEKAK
jgi:hypothetical protein